MTDRISKAVEHLGAEKTVKRDGKEGSEPNLEVRIGAILSLERIARDSTDHDKGRDHVRVMEILCAYIRHNAPAKDAKDHPFGDWEPLRDDATDEQRAAREVEREKRFGDGFGNGQVAKWARTLSPPRADIAEALKVLGRRSREQMRVEAAWPHPPEPGTAWPFDNAPHLPDEPGAAPITPEELDAFRKRLSEWTVGTRGYPGHRLDLRGTNLQGADLSNGWFQGAKLEGARLEGANLWRARLEGANLWRAQLEGAFCGHARLEGVTLFRARLEGAHLDLARLQGAHLWEARLEGASLRETRLEGARLGETRLERSLLWEARLEGAALRGTRVEGAMLVGARLYGATLTRARFDNRTSLKDAELQNASWTHVELSMLAISQDQINSTFGDASVILPQGLTRPAHLPA